MGFLIDNLLLIVAFILTLPLLVFAIECVAALFAPRRAGGDRLGDAFNTVVLIPAHNEESMIAATLNALQASRDCASSSLPTTVAMRPQRSPASLPA